MQIIFPVQTVNRYFVVYMNTIVCYYPVDKTNSINDIK